MQKKILLSVFGGLLSLFFLGLGCRFDPSPLFTEQTMAPLSPAMANRTISQNFEDKVVWHKNQITIRRGFFPSPGLLAGHGCIAYVNFIGGPLSLINQLDLLDAKTGTTLWQSKRFPTHEDVAIKKDRAFVMLHRGSPLNIYDLKGDSQPIVSVNYFNEPTKFNLFAPAAEENIYIYYIQGNEFALHSVDLTGKEVATPRKIQTFNPLSNLFLFSQPFFLLTGEEYRGGNLETGNLLWQIPASGRVDSWPVLLDKTLIISAGDGKRYALMAIDILNGRRLWESEKVFGSNVVLHRDSLYVLRNDATLVKIAVTTGQVEEEITFTPASIDAGQSAYWLASDEETLFVYFGDSQELFALNVP